MGAEVIAISHSPDKREEALSLGAADFVLDTELDKLKGSMDMILNTVSSQCNYR